MRLLKWVSSTLIVFLVAVVTNSVGVSGCGDDSGDGAVLDTLKTFEGDAIVETRYDCTYCTNLALQGTRCAAAT